MFEDGEKLLRVVAQENMSKRLHRFTAAIIWKETGKIGRGTGLLVSANLILTVAHNLYYGPVRVQNNSIKIYPGAFVDLKNLCTIEKVYIPEEY